MRVGMVQLRRFGVYLVPLHPRLNGIYPLDQLMASHDDFRNLLSLFRRSKAVVATQGKSRSQR